MTDRASLRQILTARNAAGESLRTIAQCFPGVTYGDVARIIKQGKFPADRKKLRALGLVGRRPRTEMQKQIDGMVRRTRKAVLIVRSKKK